MKLINLKDFQRVARIDKYYQPSRWNYYKEVIKILEKEKPTSTLELGSYRLPMVKDCETMDILSELNPTYIHDATETPWPIKKHYDMFIALQTWEHLENKQRQVFKEVTRIADKAILSFPYMWHYKKDIEDLNKEEKSHREIGREKIKYWTLGIKPVYEKLVGTRLIYLFNFRK